MRKNGIGARTRNKIVGAVCSVALVAGLCPVVALAADENGSSYDANSKYSANLEQTTSSVIANQTFDVNLQVKTSDSSTDPLSAMEVTVKYDPAKVSLGDTDETVAFNDSFESGLAYDDGNGTAVISFYGNHSEDAELTAATLTFTGKKAGSTSIKISDALAGASGQIDDKGVNFDQSALSLKVLFPDVTDSSRFYFNSVYAAVDRGILNGYANGNFGPNDTLTRAQAAVILWGIYGKPAYGTTNTTGMPDVKDNAYYTAAANWAVDKGVINGAKTSEGLRFNPDGMITRQDLCVMISNTAYRLNGASIGNSDRTKLEGMNDAETVSAYAQNAVAWSLNNGVINGRAGSVAPKDNVTRGEMATIAMNALRHNLIG